MNSKLPANAKYLYQVNLFIFCKVNFKMKLENNKNDINLGLQEISLCVHCFFLDIAVFTVKTKTYP